MQEAIAKSLVYRNSRGPRGLYLSFVNVAGCCSKKEEKQNKKESLEKKLQNALKCKFCVKIFIALLQ